MPTPREESPAGGGNAQLSAGAYLPSPPQSPASPHVQQIFSDVGVDDNTATGMVAAQAHSIYDDRIGQSSDGLCNRDLEKLTSQQCDLGSSSVPEASVPALLGPPAAEDVVTQQSSNDRMLSSLFPDASTVVSMPSANDSLHIFLPSAREEPTPVLFVPSPPPALATSNDNETTHAGSTTDSALQLTSEFSAIRLTPSFTSSFFRPGSKFTGTQQSDRQIYNVDVEILDVSIPDSSVSGYLRICGLTDTYPTLTTYFEGEIIGTRHTFQTKHPSWGATDKTDMQHWARFPAWRPLAKEARRPGFSFGQEWWNREHIFMRWKEHFLVPDHRVRSIQGASFEGFYYICYNQIEGKISGIYFHAKSEKYQQLELEHVPHKGCVGALEFR